MTFYHRLGRVSLPSSSCKYFQINSPRMQLIHRLQYDMIPHLWYVWSNLSMFRSLRNCSMTGMAQDLAAMGNLTFMWVVLNNYLLRRSRVSQSHTFLISRNFWDSSASVLLTRCWVGSTPCVCAETWATITSLDRYHRMSLRRWLLCEPHMHLYLQDQWLQQSGVVVDCASCVWLWRAKNCLHW